MTFSDILALITQSQTIILGTFDTSEDGTPSPIQYCTSRWQFLTENSTFISLFNIAKGGGGGGGEAGKVSQYYWPRLKL